MDKILKICCIGVILIPFYGIGFASMVDEDIPFSGAENRKLQQKVEFSVEKFLKDEYAVAYETYYQDQFPFRDEWITYNQWIRRFYTWRFPISHIAGIHSLLDPEGQLSFDEIPLQILDPRLSVLGDDSVYVPFDQSNPMIADGLLVTNNSAMELFRFDPDKMDRFAAIINRYGQDLPQVDTYVMLVPSACEFFAPEELRSEIGSQKEAFNYLHSQLNGVNYVDLYTTLSQRLNEYLYFRTDHHWTTRGAYYGYDTFITATGATPVLPETYTYGYREGFLGSMYLASAQNHTNMPNQPDVIEYFIPDLAYTAISYQDQTLTEGELMHLVHPDYDQEDTLYNTFLGGDSPILEITTEIENGKTLVIVRDSYGHAILPYFLPNYEKIYVVEPRYFNSYTFPALDLIQLVEDVEADELLFFNYSMFLSGGYWYDWCVMIEGMHPSYTKDLP